MASRRLYVSNGITVDAAWTKYIAVSENGVNWTTIPKEGTMVRSSFRSSGNTIPPNVIGPRLNTRISLVDSGGTQIMGFECDNVINQATWQGKTPAALQVAVDDITTWLSL
jgi:hypothetical protein